jgi:hypothetical protein
MPYGDKKKKAPKGFIPFAKKGARDKAKTKKKK